MSKSKFTAIQLQEEEENLDQQILNCDLMEADTPNGSGLGLGLGGSDSSDGSGTPSPDSALKKKEWGSYTEFLLASLSYAVGLGNIWRFPYLVYRNGGGAFFVPYFVMLSFVGIPLFVMEFAFGQYMQVSPVKIWKVAPLFTGIGYAMCIMSALVSIYYNMIIAWAMRYLVTSLFFSIDWSSCSNAWNTAQCMANEATNCTARQGTMLFNGTCALRSCVFTGNGTDVTTATLAGSGRRLSPQALLESTGPTAGLVNCSIPDSVWRGYLLENTVMPSDEYFHRKILNVSSGMDDFGGLQLDLVFCLFICWAIVFACLFNGLKSMGKSSYFTAFFPYGVLIVLFFRCVFLEGASKGITFYVTPQWEQLKNVHVWSDAAMQIFFSLSPCWGGIITLAKGNSLRHNFIKDAFYISIGNCLTSVFAGFVIFSIIGFMAHEMNAEVKDVVTQGAGLAFVAYPEAVSRMPVSRLWAILFFTMLCTLGFGTQFTLIESVVSTITETMYSSPNRGQKRRVLFLTVLGFFACGMILCSQAGVYILQLMDDHCASFSALLIGLAEVNALVWVFGVDRFLRVAQKMLGTFPLVAPLWKVIWVFVTPTILASLFLSSVWKYSVPSYGHYQFPVWSAIFGWLFTLSSVLAIPAVAIYKVVNFSHGSLSVWERIQHLCKPSPRWVPPRFGDDDDEEEEDSSSDDHLRNRHSSRRGNSGGGGGGSGNGGAGGGSARQMTKMGGKGGGKSGGKKKSRQLLDANLPTHCESQIALKNNEERDDEDDDDDSEDSSGQIGVYVDGSASSHYVAPGFRSTNSSASSVAAVNLGGVTNGALQVNHSRTTSYESDSGLKMFPTPTTNSSSSSNSTNSTSKKGGSGGGGK